MEILTSSTIITVCACVFFVKIVVICYLMVKSRLGK